MWRANIYKEEQHFRKKKEKARSENVNEKDLEVGRISLSTLSALQCNDWCKICSALKKYCICKISFNGDNFLVWLSWYVKSLPRYICRCFSMTLFVLWMNIKWCALHRVCKAIILYHRWSIVPTIKIFQSFNLCNLIICHWMLVPICKILLVVVLEMFLAGMGDTTNCIWHTKILSQVKSNYWLLIYSFISMQISILVCEITQWAIRKYNIHVTIHFFLDTAGITILFMTFI